MRPKPQGSSAVPYNDFYVSILLIHNLSALKSLGNYISNFPVTFGSRNQQRDYSRKDAKHVLSSVEGYEKFGEADILFCALASWQENLICSLQGKGCATASSLLHLPN